MLLVKLSDGTFLVGIDATNIKRLQDNQPIMINLGKIGGRDDIILVYGETLNDIKQGLEELTGTKLPELHLIDKNKLS